MTLHAASRQLNTLKYVVGQEGTSLRLKIVGTTYHTLGFAHHVTYSGLPIGPQFYPPQVAVPLAGAFYWITYMLSKPWWPSAQSTIGI